MRHRVNGRKFSRTSAHRIAMRRNMAISLFQHGAIRTTEQKAKDIRSFVEKLITMARKNTVHARRLVSSELGNRRGVRGYLYDNDENLLDKGIIELLFEEIAPRYANRAGGYTRIIRLAERRLGDGGRQVILQLVEEGASRSKGGSSNRRKKAEKRFAAANAVSVAAPAVAEEPAPAEADTAADAPEQSEE